MLSKSCHDFKDALPLLPFPGRRTPSTPSMVVTKNTFVHVEPERELGRPRSYTDGEQSNFDLVEFELTDLKHPDDSDSDCGAYQTDSDSLGSGYQTPTCIEPCTGSTGLLSTGSTGFLSLPSDPCMGRACGRIASPEIVEKNTFLHVELERELPRPRSYTDMGPSTFSPSDIMDGSMPDSDSDSDCKDSYDDTPTNVTSPELCPGSPYRFGPDFGGHLTTGPSSPPERPAPSPLVLPAGYPPQGPARVGMVPMCPVVPAMRTILLEPSLMSVRECGFCKANNRPFRGHTESECYKKDPSKPAKECSFCKANGKAFRGHEESECYSRDATKRKHLALGKTQKPASPTTPKTAKPTKPTTPKTPKPAESPKSFASPKSRLLAEHIHSSMKAKNMGITEAVLVADVYLDVWKELTGASPTWSSRAAVDKFERVLLQWPDLFNCSRVAVFGTKSGERMVRLVTQEADEEKVIDTLADLVRVQHP